MPKHSRHVGQGISLTPIVSFPPLDPLSSALKFLSPNTNPPVPWHRVIGASGTISSRGPGTQGAQRQRDVLVAEGVEVTVGRMGDLRVDFGRWGWFPAPGQVGDAAPDAREDEEEDQDVS